MNSRVVITCNAWTPSALASSKCVHVSITIVLSRRTIIISWVTDKATDIEAFSLQRVCVLAKRLKTKQVSVSFHFQRRQRLWSIIHTDSLQPIAMKDTHKEL